ncbi:hypothetical protein FA95DRAFT_1609302, partial [Auriscalpium vulgare]
SSVIKSHPLHTAPSNVLPPLDQSAQKHSCGREHAQCFVSVTVEESPLGDGLPSDFDSNPDPADYLLRPVKPTAEPEHPAKEDALSAAPAKSAWNAVRSLAAMAARVQQAYVAATLATLASADYASEESVSRSPSASPARSVRPQGSRVEKADVAHFIGAQPLEQRAEPYALFLLRDLPSRPPSRPSSPSRSPAPSALPRTFPFFRQAYNHHAQQPITLDHLTPAPRPRPVANPRHMLSRAVANARRAKTGGLPPQKFYAPERVLGVAWDVHHMRAAQDAAGGGESALKWGWRMVWDERDAQ